MGRNLLAPLVALCAISLPRAASAVEQELQITPRVGFGRLEVDQFVGLNSEHVDVDTYGLGANIGYLTPIGVVLEIGADSFRDFDLFGTFEGFRLEQAFASIGYQFDLGNRWRLVPRVGRAHWELRSREGRIFNPGPEEERNVKGDNYFWEIGVARQISSVVTLGMNYKRGQYEFGSTQSVAFAVTLGF
jgi:hypothetical protein